MSYNSKQYKTLPGQLRPRTDRKKSQEAPHSPLFGLNLNLHFSNIISSGVNFFDNLRRKTPTTPQPRRANMLSSQSSSSSSTASPGDGEEEHIEMVPFQHTEVCGQGEGHVWREGGSQNPTWCDLCGELIWGLYTTGTWVCENCNYTAHLHCRDKVKLDCSSIQSVSEDTDGVVQSLCFDDTLADADDLTSLSSSYATAADTLPKSSADGEAVLSTKDSEDDDPHTSSTLVTTNNRDRTEDDFYTLESLSSTDIFHTLKDSEDVQTDEDEYHTLKGIADLSPEEAIAPGGSGGGNPSGAGLLLALPQQELSSCLAMYNKHMPAGQQTAFDPDNKLFKGFIRVEMNLQRPINVISGTRPPSVYNIIKEDTICDRTLTTFYLPPDTEKPLHITSHTTTQDVIRCLLKKFKVADNPHKFALYEKCADFRRDSSLSRNKSLSRPKMRRLLEDEKPLVFAILWGAANSGQLKKFVLQENDPGEIVWDRFSLPELKNFLLILDREEAWYKRRIHEKYDAVQTEIQRLLDEKR